MGVFRQNMVKIHIPPSGGESEGAVRWGIRVVFVVLVLLMITLLVVAFEFYARWHYRDVVQTAHGWDYFFYKSFTKIIAENNNHKFRGRDFDIAKGDTFRVVVIGDSFAWGQGVFPYTNRFPELAETILKKRFPDFDIEIINLGYPGRDLHDHVDKLQFVIRLHPDFVLYQWFVNDVDEDADVAAFHSNRFVPSEKLHQKMKLCSVTYILMPRAWNQLRAIVGLQKSYDQYLYEKFQDKDSEPSVKATGELHALIMDLHNSGIAMGIVLFPQLDSSLDKYKLGFLHERVLEECLMDHIRGLDLREAYSVYNKSMRELWANPLDSHPGVLAHRIAAEKIVETFGPVWLELERKQKDLL